MHNEIEKQRAYYAESAQNYDDLHIKSEEPEHDFALATLHGLAAYYKWSSFLDIGAGTGRGVVFLQQKFPQASVLGVEPVEELRRIGYQKGIAPEVLIHGDALALEQKDKSADCVLALGIMHHIPKPRQAILEMLRVCNQAVFISDLNNFGCGSFAQRLFAHTLEFFGLWKAFQFVKNGFKHWKYSEGDGVHYSYSLLNEVKWIAAQGFDVHVIGTKPSHKNLYWTASHVALLAVRKK